LVEGEPVGAPLRRDDSGHEVSPTVNRSGASRLWRVIPLSGVAMVLLLVMTRKESTPVVPPPVVPTAPTVTVPLPSEARQLVAKARPLFEDLDSNTLADYETAEQLFKRALELAPLDAEVWANYSWFCSNCYGIGFDRTP